MGQDFSVSDIPVEKPENDLLGYSAFAENLAKSLLNIADPKGLVVSINGQWGSGKTSVINFTKYYLEHNSTDNNPIIINFNPWYFSGQEALTREFFNELMSGISVSHDQQKKFKEDLALICDIIGKMPVPYSKFGTFISGKLKQHTPLGTLRKRISDILSEQPEKIVIIIDDIDRLSCDEIRQLFKLIKSVANFSNVIYLLAYDDVVIKKALSSEQLIDGGLYLEKIVQMPFHLPMPDRHALNKMFLENLEQATKNCKLEESDVERWQNALTYFISHYLKTPRAIIRLINTLTISYSSVENEINVVDFIIIETIRVFHPEVYDYIRGNEYHFSMNEGDLGPLEQVNVEEMSKVHNEWLGKIVDEKTRYRMTECIKLLFPKVADVLNNNQPQPTHREWRRTLRVCCPECFKTYFRLSLPSDQVSSMDFKNFIDNLVDENATSKKLLEEIRRIHSDGTSYAKDYLDRLVDNIESIEIGKIPHLVFVMHDIGDKLLRREDEGNNFNGIENVFRITWIIYHGLKGFKEEERFEIYKRCFQDGRSIFIITDRFDRLNDEHDEEKRKREETNDIPSLTKEQVEQLKRIVDDRLTTKFLDYSILDVPHLSRIMFIWKNFGHEKDIDSFINGVFDNDELFLKFMNGFVSYSKKYGDKLEINYRVKPDWFSAFVNPALVYERTEKISDTYRDNESSAAIKQFRKEYEDEYFE